MRRLCANLKWWIGGNSFSRLLVFVAGCGFRRGDMDWFPRGEGKAATDAGTALGRGDGYLSCADILRFPCGDLLSAWFSVVPLRATHCLEASVSV